MCCISLISPASCFYTLFFVNNETYIFFIMIFYIFNVSLLLFVFHRFFFALRYSFIVVWSCFVIQMKLKKRKTTNKIKKNVGSGYTTLPFISLHICIFLRLCCWCPCYFLGRSLCCVLDILDISEVGKPAGCMKQAYNYKLMKIFWILEFEGPGLILLNFL